jgi:hypothetical protein
MSSAGSKTGEIISVSTARKAASTAKGAMPELVWHLFTIVGIESEAALKRVPV